MSECIDWDTEETQPIHYQFFDQQVDTNSTRPLTYDKLDKKESFVSLDYEEEMNQGTDTDQNDYESERSPFKSPEAAPEKGFTIVGQGSIVETYSRMSDNQRRVSENSSVASNGKSNGDKSSTSSPTVINHTEVKDDEHNNSVGDEDERPPVVNSETVSKTPAGSEHQNEIAGYASDYSHSESLNENNTHVTEAAEEQSSSPKLSPRTDAQDDRSLNEEGRQTLKTASDNYSEYSYSESVEDSKRRSPSPKFEDKSDATTKKLETDIESEREEEVNHKSDSEQEEDIDKEEEFGTSRPESDKEEKENYILNELDDKSSEKEESDEELNERSKRNSKLIVIEEKTEDSYSEGTFENFTEKESTDMNQKSHTRDKFTNKALPAIGITNGVLELENFQRPGFLNRPHRKQPPAPIKMKLSHEQKMDAIHNRPKPWLNNMSRPQPKPPVQPVSIIEVRKAGRIHRPKPWQTRVASETTSQTTFSDNTIVNSEVSEKPVANVKPILRKPERVEMAETKRLVRVQSSSKARPGIPTQLKSVAYWQENKLYITITGPSHIIDFVKRKNNLDSIDEVPMDVNMTFVQEKRKKKQSSWRQKPKAQSKVKLPPINVDRNIVDNRAVYKPFQF
ncbi:unnamed protein product [Dimorphilus gyrociliatus]|uniref:Uncharacterized protein n=1 Tax=Dimorphilus gyrociliatus TaxID=2664684 RepID=A0A7I8VLF3_9ANNE|nr:unnamed protein product [Dimorphilus gyrociliatus]